MSDILFCIITYIIYAAVVILYIVQAFDQSRIEKRVKELERIMKAKLEGEHGGRER